MSSDEQAIADVISTWAKATSEGDLKRLIPLMSQDVAFLAPGRPAFGIKEFAEGFTKNLEKAKISPDVQISEIHASGELAYAVCQLSVTVTPLDGGTPVVRSGSTLTVYRKQANGEWVLIRDANLLT